jgi:hypothetical protein
VTRITEGFSHFVASIAAPVASGWSGCRVGLAPTGKRHLFTAHTLNGPSSQSEVIGGFQFTAIVRLGTPNNESSGAIAIIRKKRWP